MIDDVLTPTSVPGGRAVAQVVVYTSDTRSADYPSDYGDVSCGGAGAVG